MTLWHRYFPFALTPSRIKSTHLAGPRCFILRPVEHACHLISGVPRCTWIVIWNLVRKMAGRQVEEGTVVQFEWLVVVYWSLAFDVAH